MKRLIHFIVLGLVLGCGPTDIHIDWAHRPTSFKVEVRNNPSSAKNPLPLTGNKVSVTIDATALSAEGMKPLITFSKWVHVYARPGILKITEPGDAYNPANVIDKGAYVYMKNGRIQGVKVQLDRSFGDTRIWVEDNGFVPPTVGTAQCADGKDNNGDGMIDMQDPGCLNAQDHSEEGGTGAAGVSETIYFQSPRLSDVQGHASVTQYPHEEVDVTRGFMVVTRITNAGFYITDVEDKSGYNSMYVYSYHTPPFLSVCDRITEIRGTVSEFYGFTELNFPSWSFLPWNNRNHDPLWSVVLSAANSVSNVKQNTGKCYVPDPTVLTPSMVMDKNKMESLESGLVRIRNITTGDTPKVCDFNGNGKVCGNSNTEGDECQCRKNCDNDPFCSTVLNYRSYGQWAAVLDDNRGHQVKIWVISDQTVPGFDPFKDGGRRHVSSITGTLKEFKYLRPYPWIIEVRCPDDLVVTGEPKKANESCVYPRSGAMDEPN